MRAFVTGTGRCGTKTFARACSHITNLTSGHETNRGRFATHLVYPVDHVEVDPHLAFMLARLVELYPDAVFVHLWRDEDEVVASWRRRGILPHRGAAPLIDVIFQTRSLELDAADYDSALRALYRSIVARCDALIRLQERYMRVNIYDAAGAWPEFCELVGAEGDLEAGRAEFSRRA